MNKKFSSFKFFGVGVPLLALLMLTTVVRFGYQSAEVVDNKLEPRLERNHTADEEGSTHIPVNIKVDASVRVPSLLEINIPRLLSLNRSNVLFKCPPKSFPSYKSADGMSVREAQHKYSGYTKNYCNTSGLLQMHFTLPQYIYFMDVLSKLVEMRRGDVLLDWASGCGTMLNYFHLRHNTSGLGIDITEPAVIHANTHAQDRQVFCHADGTRALRHFKSNTFDGIVSWAGLYHVRRTLVQCETVNEMARVVKPGRKIIIAHLRTEKTQKYWTKRKCQVENASYVRLMDWRLFREKSFRKHGFFSILVTKDG